MTTICCSVGTILFMLNYTTRARGSILTLFDSDSLTDFEYAFLIIIQFGIIISLWMGIMFFTSISVITNFSVQSIVGRFKYFLLSSNTEYSTDDDLNRFVQILFYYKQLQLCLMLFNEIISPYFLVLVSNGLTGLSVMALIFVIGYHQHAEIIALLTISIAMIMATLTLILIQDESGKLNDASLNYLKMSKRKVALSKLSKQNKVLLLSYTKSLQPLKIQYGSFGYNKKPNSPRIITRIIYYSVKGIMTLRKIM